MRVTARCGRGLWPPTRCPRGLPVGGHAYLAGEPSHLGHDPSQVADLRLPDRQGLASVVVLIHGSFGQGPFS